ncbi:uncharacterized protein [Mobula birostris]|uniref:uncharacterized protein n=1 Tax=Mobula birostris TaxID=1983395 RepID=UPI003B27BA22
MKNVGSPDIQLHNRKASDVDKATGDIHGCRGVPGAVHNPDLIETAVRSAEEHLEKLLKCPLRCRCYCAMENLRRRRPQILGCLLPVAGVGVEALGRDGARCSVLESWSEARSFRTDSESDNDRMLPGCCTGKLAALEVHRLREMMGLSRDFETLRLFTVPMVCSLTNYGIALHCCNHMLQLCGFCQFFSRFIMCFCNIILEKHCIIS